jgi:Fic family protein
MGNLPLQLNNGSSLYIRNERYKKTQDELDTFLSDKKHLQTKSFAKDVMFSHEIKANNQIEGFYDDVNIIKAIIEKRYPNIDNNQAKRILNLYHGYNYILKGKEINKDTLRYLYQILSTDLLEERDRLKSGNYYRDGDVFIFYSSNIDKEPDMGINASKIDQFMDSYFNFLNSVDCNNITEEYIKSQILHFYFVYIHPYFDVNGRTSRTLSMWYLLNKKAYPYIIFNRGITFNKRRYYEVIRDVKKFRDISFFIDYMLKTVQTELEKEFIMQHIHKESHQKLTSTDFQSLLYLLSMNGEITVSDFATTYNRFNGKRHNQYIYENMIDPLIQKGILKVVRTTNKNMFGDCKNEVIAINSDLLDIDPKDINRLVRFKKEV